MYAYMRQIVFLLGQSLCVVPNVHLTQTLQSIRRRVEHILATYRDGRDVEGFEVNVSFGRYHNFALKSVYLESICNNYLLSRLSSAH